MHAHNQRIRHARLIARYEPYDGCVGGNGYRRYCSTFPVPACIVNAESHGLVHEHSHPWSSSGLVQIELGTWHSEGGLKYAQFPYEASKLQQSIVASRIWAHGAGAGQWSVAAACGY